MLQRELHGILMSASSKPGRFILRAIGQDASTMSDDSVAQGCTGAQMKHCEDGEGYGDWDKEQRNITAQ